MTPRMTSEAHSKLHLHLTPFPLNKDCSPSPMSNNSLLTGFHPCTPLVVFLLSLSVLRTQCHHLLIQASCLGGRGALIHGGGNS